LDALTAQRSRQQGVALPLADVLAVGWPGESPVGDSGAARVYDAVRTLRKMGLDAVIVRSDGGYLVHPSVRVARLERDDVPPVVVG
jgi:hypothetical protein